VNEEKHTTCVQLSESVWQTLKEIADRKGVTVSDVLREHNQHIHLYTPDYAA